MKSTDGREVESYRDQRDVEVKEELRGETILWAGPLPPNGWRLAGVADRKGGPLIELAPGGLLEAKH
jgi:hypothetical protein